jgi:hypothetical protein
VAIFADGNVTVPEGVSINQTPVNVDLLGSDLMSSATGSRITALGNLAVAGRAVGGYRTGKGEQRDSPYRTTCP